MPSSDAMETESQNDRDREVSRPNVVVILCDQMRAMDVGCYGSAVVQTPNIDALAARGLQCSKAITNNPVCVPARSILMSGQHSRTCTGSRHNHAPATPTNRERNRMLAQTWPELFREAGYTTNLIGKWHIDPVPDLVGFDHWVSPTSIGSQGRFMEDGQDIGRQLGFAQDYELNRFGEFCDERASEEGRAPFFCYYNIYSPHMPLAEMPLYYHRLYDRNDVPVRPNVPARSIPENWIRCYLWEHADGEGTVWPSTDRVPDGFDVRDLTALYYGAISWVDDLVGGAISHLERTGLRDNTIVVFASDHGDNLGSHAMWNKDRFWEESIRIPLVVDDPRVPQSTETDAAVGLVDCLPTVAELCDIPVPEHVQGRSFASAVRDPAALDWNEVSFLETTTWENAVVGTRYKYARRAHPEPGKRIRPHLASPDDGTTEFLFDLIEDPFELTNRISDTSLQPEVRRLRAQLDEWDRTTPWLDLATGEHVTRASEWRSE